MCLFGLPEGFLVSIPSASLLRINPVNGDCLRQSVGQFQGGFSAYHSTRELIRIQDVRQLQARIIFTASAVTAPTNS